MAEMMVSTNSVPVLFLLGWSTDICNVHIRKKKKKEKCLIHH